MAGGYVVEPIGQDKYQIQGPDGVPRLATGQAGAKLYEDYQRSQSAIGPNATADAGSFLRRAAQLGANAIPVVGPQVGRLIGNSSETATDALPPGPQSPPVPAEPPKERVGQTVDEHNRPIAAPGQEASAAPAAAQQQGTHQLPYAAEGIDPVTGKKFSGPAFMVNGQMMVMRPGTKGSPGGLTALGKEIMSDREKAQAAAAPLRQAVAEAGQEGVQIAVADNAKQQAYLEKQKELAAQQAQQENQEMIASQMYEAQMREKLAKADEEYEAAARGPGEQSLGQSLLAGLGSAMGAFGAAIGHTPNFAGEFIQQLATNKIRKWEAETAIKGKRADNLLARYQAITGDIKTARAAVYSTLYRQLAIETQQGALSTASEQAQNAYKQMAAAAGLKAVEAGQKESQEWKLDFYKDKFLNKPAVSGSAGGFAPATQEAFEKGRAGDIAVEDASVRQYKAQQEADKAARAAASPHVGFRGQATIVAAKVARGAIDELAGALGAERNSKTGEYENPSWGSALGSKIPYGDVRQKLNAARLTAISEIGKAQTGGVLTENAAHEMVGQVEAADTPGEWGAFLRHYERTMKHVEETVRDVAATSGSPYEREEPVP